MRSLRLSGGESGPYSEDVHMEDSDHHAEEDDRDDMEDSDHHAEEDDSHRDDIDERDDDDPSLSVTGRFVCFFHEPVSRLKKKKKFDREGHVQPV